MTTMDGAPLPPAAMRRRIRRRLGILAILVCGEYLFIPVFGEPYPALMMPGFRTAGGSVDAATFEIRSCDVLVEFGDGTADTVAFAEFVSHLPSSHTGALRQFFIPQSWRRNPPDDLFGAGFERAFKVLLPGYVLSYANPLFHVDAPVDITRWVDARASQMFPNQDVSRVRFITYTEILTVVDEEVRRARTDLGEFLVVLP